MHITGRFRHSEFVNVAKNNGSVPWLLYARVGLLIVLLRRQKIINMSLTYCSTSTYLIAHTVRMNQLAVLLAMILSRRAIGLR